MPTPRHAGAWRRRLPYVVLCTPWEGQHRQGRSQERPRFGNSWQIRARLARCHLDMLCRARCRR